MAWEPEKEASAHRCFQPDLHSPLHSIGKGTKPLAATKDGHSLFPLHVVAHEVLKSECPSHPRKVVQVSVACAANVQLRPALCTYRCERSGLTTGEAHDPLEVVNPLS